MIPIEALSQVTRIIVHADCPDGMASAMVLHDVLPSAVVIAIQYGQAREALEPAEHDLFCDMTPPESKADAFIAAGAIVLDHHQGAKELVARFGDRGVFSNDPGVSGAVLAYREIWQRIDRKTADSEAGKLYRQQKIKHFCELVGVRDTWQTDHPSWKMACAYGEILMLCPLEQWLEQEPPYLTGDRELAGLDLPEVTLIAGFFYTVKSDRMQLVFSLRSNPGAEVTALQAARAAQRIFAGCTGGGHKHAAGFTVLAAHEGMNRSGDVLYGSPVEILRAALQKA